mmetsp:Transcript_30519/g.79127  ORF Transcript_30519/g.79127 Transcript_30519/m.79127 type:complete len:128 (-) Transcript_30519:172-555(-)
MVIGDKQKFLTCVLTVKLNPNETGTGFTDKLTEGAVRALSADGIDATTITELSRHDAFYQKVHKALEVYNKQHAVSNAQTIKKFVLLKTDFSIDGNELTPTMKLKRKIVLSKYATEIQGMYGDAWVN